MSDRRARARAYRAAAAGTGLTSLHAGLSSVLADLPDSPFGRAVGSAVRAAGRRSLVDALHDLAIAVVPTGAESARERRRRSMLRWSRQRAARR